MWCWGLQGTGPSDWAFCAPAYKWLQKLLEQSLVFAILIVVREPVLINSNQLLRSLCPWSMWEKKASIETGISRAPASITCQIQSIKASKAPRGGDQTAAAYQNVSPAQKEAGKPEQSWAKEQSGEVRTCVKASSKAAGLGISCWRSQERGPQVAGVAWLIEGSSQHFRMYFTEPSGLLERMLSENSQPSMDFCKWVFTNKALTAWAL